jgi:hypothetical protein
MRLIFTAGWLALCVFVTGCSSHGFDDYTIKSAAEQAPITIDREQVSLTDAQVNCGVMNDLWEDAQADNGQRAIYHLTPKGRELQFSDDVYARDPEYDNTAYTQVRGKFSLSLAAIVAARDGSDGGKLVQATLGLRIPHPCFADPVLIMGVNKGKFTTKNAPTLLYEQTGENSLWTAIKLVH